jgi:hypothetical protein
MAMIGYVERRQASLSYLGTYREAVSVFSCGKHSVTCFRSIDLCIIG